jgi:multicomponent Na+:H+ antiporter subunit F
MPLMPTPAVTLENLLVLLLGLLLLPMLYALRRGPSTADRVLALEVISTLGALMLLVLSNVAGRPIYLDLAVLLTLFSFLGTLVMARYLERGLLR